MVGIRERKRTELKERLLQSTIKRIQTDGINSLRARDLANDAGCALGAIYTIYDDLEELIFYAKVEIFRQMEKKLDQTMKDASQLSPLDQMRKLTASYFAFANDHTNLWSALFTGDLTDRRDVPDWYQEALQRLMSHISTPLKKLSPKLSDTELSLRTRALFSSIHGIILLTIQDRPSGVSRHEVEFATDWVLNSICNSLK